MKSYNAIDLGLCSVTVIVTCLFMASAQPNLLSPYDPQCVKSVCQKFNSEPVPCTNQNVCVEATDADKEQKLKLCHIGCSNFKKAMQIHSVNGCSQLCNLTELEITSSWSVDSERKPILACLYGCHRATKKFVTHIFDEIKTIRPPQIVDYPRRLISNETSVTLTFSKQTERRISGSVFKACLSKLNVQKCNITKS